MAHQITYHDCYQDLLSREALNATSALNEWSNRGGYQHVVDFVQNFTHSYLFEVGPDEVRTALEASSHALGDVRKEEQIRTIENFTSPFALQHLLHWYIETHRSIPTWKNFRDWMVEGDAAPHWHALLAEKLYKTEKNIQPEQWSRAARWRLGKFYLSAMREIDLLARARSAGVPLRYHLLADVLLRIDFWVNDLAICLYFPNSRYRQGNSGRKTTANTLFQNASPSLRIEEFCVPRQGQGNFWLATEEDVQRLVRLASGQ